jgi:hypothetical protein
MGMWADLEQRGLVLPVQAKGAAWQRPLWPIPCHEPK